MNERWLRTLFGRRMFISLLIILQAVLVIYLIVGSSQVSQVLYTVFYILSIFIALFVVMKKDKGAYKTAWIVLILLFPVLGGPLYVIFNYQISTRLFTTDIQTIRKRTVSLFPLPGDSKTDAQEHTGHYFAQIAYLQNYVGYPVYANTQTTYFPLGEEMFHAVLEELEKAERYIFLEFFIVQEGYMWNSILEVLKRKAALGVKVRLLYDDIGCFIMLPHDYQKQMEQLGIECRVFNPFRPLLSARQNNRDHRKIIVIDGITAFTGGINLADEYINAVVKFGHWKDTAVRLRGKAAWSFALIFLEMWHLCKSSNENLMDYYPWADEACPIETDGYVLPYADSPMDKEYVGEQVYIQLLNNARSYVYINTPYLILDDSMVDALTSAAKRGVDVCITTPHKWDKRLIHITTRSYYRELIRAGVKIYEYTHGFIHAKSMVSDDNILVIGTTNLDFRSLYLHFECGVWIYGSRAVTEAKEDFIQTQKSCQRIQDSDCKTSLPGRLVQEVLRLLAPLM